MESALEEQIIEQAILFLLKCMVGEEISLNVKRMKTFTQSPFPVSLLFPCLSDYETKIYFTFDLIYIWYTLILDTDCLHSI